MKKKCLYYSSLVLVIAFISLGFRPIKSDKHYWFFTHHSDKTEITEPTLDTYSSSSINVPFTGKTFVGFKEKIAHRESRGKYHIVNNFGYMGKYQFGSSALRAIGIKDNQAFLKNPKLQEDAFLLLLSKNKWELRNEIDQYSNTIIKGVHITESGILAAAHLVGAGSVKKFFKNNGNINIKDGNGTSLINYMKSFEGYDTSFIEADSLASVE